MSVMMSDMKTKSVAKKSAKRAGAQPTIRRTFTVRDMNRQPQAVLNAARKLGKVHVQSRSGERFSVEPDPEQKSGAPDVEYRRAFHDRIKDIHERMRKAGSLGITAEGWDTFSKMIAGEA